MSKYAHKTAHALYSVRVFIRFRHIRDTVRECNHRRQVYQPYVHAQTEPHFPVPSTLGEVFQGSIIIAVMNAHELKSSVEWIKGDV